MSKQKPQDVQAQWRLLNRNNRLVWVFSLDTRGTFLKRGFE
jgi:hypothetical protein